jgi:hypothetical protein
MIETTENRTRDIPIWLTGLVLLACIGGGGWLIKSYMKDRTRPTIDVDEKTLASAGIAVNGGGSGRNTGRGSTCGGNGPANWDGGGRYSRGPTRDASLDGVQQWNNSSTRIKNGNTVVMVSSAPGGRFDLSLSYFKSLRTPEQEQFNTMFNMVRQDSSWREYLKVTDDQLALFRKVPPSLYGTSPMKFEPADRAKLSELWKAYRDAAKGSAEKTAAEQALLAGVAAVGEKNAEPTKAYEQSRTEAIRKALTPEQVDLYLKAGSDRAPRATPVPATPPAPLSIPIGAVRGGATPAPTVPAPTAPAKELLKDGPK